MLQQERWGFVQKFRAAKVQAGESGAAAFDSMAAPAEMDEDEGEEEDDEDDADSDW